MKEPTMPQPAGPRARTFSGAVAALGLATFLGACAPSGDDAESRYSPVGDVQELMQSVVEPAAEVYWDAVGVIVDAEGEHQMAPTNDEEWLAVRNAAYMIAESGNLMKMPGYALDDGGWIAMSQALIDVGERAVEAADARSLEAVFDMGAEVYYVCTNCHASYAAETLRPTDSRVN
jgi:hypothetical protein